MKFRVPVRVRLTEEQQGEARRAINAALVGMENCNVYRDNELVLHPDIDPEAESRLLEAHYALARTTEVTLIATLSPETGLVAIDIERG